MKNLIIVVSFLVFSTVGFSNTTPEPLTNLVSSSEMVLTVKSNAASMFELAEITDDKSNIDFIVKENVEFVQIINNKGDVEFMLPVDSKKVRINKSLFGSDDYKLGFKIGNASDLYLVKVKMK